MAPRKVLMSPQVVRSHGAPSCIHLHQHSPAQAEVNCFCHLVGPLFDLVLMVDEHSRKCCPPVGPLPKNGGSTQQGSPVVNVLQQPQASSLGPKRVQPFYSMQANN